MTHQQRKPHPVAAKPTPADPPRDPLAQRALTPEQIRAKAMEMFGLMYGSIEPMKILQMMSTVQGKATLGDQWAVQFIDNLLQRGTRQPTADPQPPAFQVNVGSADRVGVMIQQTDPAPVEDGPAGLAVAAVRVLADRMLSAAALADELGVPPSQVERLLDAGYLRETDKGLKATDCGRRLVPAEPRPAAKPRARKLKPAE